jgi:hypothetical protein
MSPPGDFHGAVDSTIVAHQCVLSVDGLVVRRPFESGNDYGSHSQFGFGSWHGWNSSFILLCLVF